MLKYKPHLFKMTEGEDTNYWYCNDVTDFGHDSGAWWHPCRVLNISPADFILLLKNEFKCKYIRYSIEYSFLHYYWDNQSDMRKFKNYINKKARERNYLV